jgi:hypothetical protein
MTGIPIPKAVGVSALPGVNRPYHDAGTRREGIETLAPKFRPTAKQPRPAASSNMGIGTMDSGEIGFFCFYKMPKHVRQMLNSRAGRLPRLKQQIAAEPGRSFRGRLFARSAGVHVDFHAHRHFDNLRSFPTHFGSPK